MLGAADVPAVVVLAVVVLSVVVAVLVVTLIAACTCNISMPNNSVVEVAGEVVVFQAADVAVVVLAVVVLAVSCY